MRVALLVCLITFITTAAQPSTYILSRGKSSVCFEAIGRPSFLKIRGTSDKTLEGQITSDGKKLSGQCSFDLESLTTGIDARDDHMKHKYLETRKFPKATLSFTKFEITNTHKCANVPFEGVLSLHGVDHGVKGEASVTFTEQALEIDAQLELKTDDFKIEQPSFAGITMASLVKVQVTLSAPLIAQR